MGQQMFEPNESQEGQRQHRQQSQGWWSSDNSRRDRKTREIPKNEDPSTFEDPFATTSYQEGYQVHEPGEQAYRPYNAYQAPGNTASSASYAAPHWARPQRNPVFRILGTIIGVLLIATIVLKVILPVFIVTFVILAILVAVIGFISLIFLLFVLGFLRLLGIPFRPFHLVRQWRRRSYGRRWRTRFFDV